MVVTMIPPLLRSIGDYAPTALLAIGPLSAPICLSTLDDGTRLGSWSSPLPTSLQYYLGPNWPLRNALAKDYTTSPFPSLPLEAVVERSYSI